MRRSVTAALALLLALAGTARADAPSCRLVVDPQQDDYAVRDAGPSGVSVASLDIVSADVAADSRDVTGVIRVRSLALPDPGTPSGVAYDVGFRYDGRHFVLKADRTADGTSRFSVITDGELGEGSGLVIAHVDGVFDEDASEIRITSPRSVFTQVRRLRDGRPMEQPWAVSYRTSGMSEFPASPTSERRGFTVSADADNAVSDTAYAVGAPSCVRVGA